MASDVLDETSASGPGQVLEAVDIDRLLRLLPHRYPFLMVDRIVDIDGDAFGIGIKNVTFNEPHFLGHFPMRPVMPGVLMIEGMAQTAGALRILADGGDAPPLVYFLSIDKARFRKPVQPGDTIRYHVTKIRQRGSISRYQAVAKVDDVRVAEAELSAMILKDLPSGDL